MINKFSSIIKKVPRMFFQFIEMSIYKIISIFYKNNNKYKDIWLICERGTEAKDNGYWMFKYIRENHPEINVHYIIDEKYEKDYKKVATYGNIIRYKSFEHKIAFILSNKIISPYTGFIEPWSYKLYKMILDRKNKKKYIFLQHGVIYNDVSEFLNKNSVKLDKFITSTKKEYEAIANNEKYGYFNNEVVQTGLPRFDNLHNNNPKNQILLMPTWRKELTVPSYLKDGDSSKDKIFLDSEYYRRFNSLIKNKELIKILKDNNYKLVFYPHYELQRYIKYFDTENDNIVIADKDNYDVQELLMDSKLLITDYSSIFFDFAYMKKPLIHYCFDELMHYKPGYFDFRKEGFGKVASSEDEVVRLIKKYIDNNFKLDNMYENRIDKVFNIRDNKNCERVFNEIKLV
nr:CDP-glycerol glycerophosphotransferase family protein [uncultured Romboutsia sp.]